MAKRTSFSFAARMNIQIMTRNPALMFVLTRTNPIGIVVRSKSKIRRGYASVYLIDVETPRLERLIEAKMVAAWLPRYLGSYGAQHVAIDGCSAPCDEHQFRAALLDENIKAAVDSRAATQGHYAKG